MKKPENTTDQVQRDPLSFLAAAMVDGSSNAILSQEAQGQQSFVGSDTLPTKRLSQLDTPLRKYLEGIGFVFHGPVEGDPIFQYVTLPKGWSKRPTDHSMWSELIDDKGRKRASIFYKAAFYDRSAHIDFENRYSVRRNYDNEKQIVFFVKDGGKVIHTVGPVDKPDGMAEYTAADAQEKIARDWLAKTFGDTDNPTAHWDDPA